MPANPSVLFRPPEPGTLTRRLCSTTLLAQSLSVFLGGLVARQLSLATGGEQGRADLYLWGGIGLAVLCLLAAGALRTRWGVVLGWICQLLTLACALVLPAMVIVALIFGGLWWTCLSQGLKLDRLAAQRAAEQEDGSTGRPADETTARPADGRSTNEGELDR